MKHRFGVEMAESGNRLPGAVAQIVKQIAQEVNVIDRDDRLYILASSTDAEKLIDLFSENDMFEDYYELFELEEGSVTDDFPDYGFVSISGRYYLYEEITLPFRLEKTPDPKQQEMAIQQMNEHLIAKETTEETLYFTDRQHKELIERIAKAYGITVSF